jgi:hypothetical protein
MKTLENLQQYESCLKNGIESFERCPVGNELSSRAYSDALELLYSKHPELKDVEGGLVEEIDLEEVIQPILETRFPETEEEGPPYGMFWNH